MTGTGNGSQTAARRLGWRRLTLAAPGVVATLLVLIAQLVDPPLLRELGLLTFDAYQRAAPRPWRDAAVRVVDIDDASIARMGQWPWPRTDIARLNTALAGAGAAAIGWDVVFSEPDRTSPAQLARILKPDAALARQLTSLPDNDAVLARAFAASPAVTGYFMTREANGAKPPLKAGFALAGSQTVTAAPRFGGVIPPLPALSDAAPGAGFVSLVGQGDGIVRAAPLLAQVGDQLAPSLSLETLRVAQGAGAFVVKTSSASGETGGGGGQAGGIVGVKVGQFAVPTTRSGELWMYYTAPGSNPAVPAWKILDGSLSAAQLRRALQGSIVLVGTGAAGLRDVVSTPVTRGELGVRVHAQALEQMITQSFLVRPDWGPGVERFSTLVIGLLLALILPGLGAMRGGALAAVALVFAGGASWFAFRQHGLLLDPTFPALGAATAYTSTTLWTFFSEERSRAFIHRAFDRYLSPELVARIARDPSQLKLGGEERDVTVLFCDIRNFSRISEKLSPQQTISFLIAFLTPLTDLLLGRKATIDKYMGDAILAFWNAPLDDPDHERNAAFATLEMAERLKRLNASPPIDAWPDDVRIGVGLCAGPACVGNLGSEQRLNYSLIGDTVNLASRLEGLTKLYGVLAIGNERIESKLADFAVLEIDLVRVVGRARPERICALIGGPETGSSEAFAALRTAWKDVLGAYRGRDWPAAQAALDRAGVFAPAFGLERLCALYTARVSASQRDPPPAEWDGVYEAAEK